MPRENLGDLIAFLAVARERSFTRAAAQLGTSQSALSYSVKTLEKKLGVRLLTRTTRSVSATEAGQRLLEAVSPRLEEIDAELAAVSDLGELPTGTVRITATDVAIRTVIWPKLSWFPEKYPEIKLEIITDYGLTDIAAERYDIGIRLGDQVAKEMVAVRIAPDFKFCIVGAPAYFRKHPYPASPRDLTSHNCINLRLPTHGGLYSWELRRDDESLDVRVDGQLTFSNTYQIVDAALGGHGLAYVPFEIVSPQIDAGQLVLVLGEWSPSFPGYHAYFPSRRQSRAVNLVIDALRFHSESVKPPSKL